MRLGIDLGGTKIAAAAMADDGTLGPEHRAPTPSDYDQILATIAGLIAEIEPSAGRIDRVGIGTPGAVSPHTGRIKNAFNTGLNGRSFVDDLQRVLDRPVRTANDANCFALSEAVDGAAAGAKIVFGVIVGTGCGGGIVVDRQVLTGANAISGEWGHNPLPWPTADEIPAPVCNCGRAGCIELYLSGTGLARDHLAVTGEALSSEAIVAAAGPTLDRYLDRMARSLASAINFLDPDVIVLGGGLSQVDVLYEEVPKRWAPYVFSDHVATRLVPNQHGASGGLRGAAWLWPTD